MEDREGTRKRNICEEFVTEMFCPFVSAHYRDNESSYLIKTLLLLYAMQKELRQP